MRKRVIAFVIAGIIPALFAAPPNPVPDREEELAGQTVLQQYFSRTPLSQAWLRDVSMNVEMNGSLPSLNKSGTMRALRQISRVGRITYDALTFQGDNTVKKDVIARYMEAEMKATDGNSIAINEKNYKFKYRGLVSEGDWQLHLFELSPRAKRVGLFKGWLWIHAATGLPVREQGELVKNPSIFLKRVSFVRDYVIENGVAIPKRLESTIETRVVGRAELKIDFSNVTKQESRQFAARNTDGN